MGVGWVGTDVTGPSHWEGPSRLLYTVKGGPKRLQETERSANEGERPHREGSHQKFRQARIQSGEMYAQFGVHLDHYLNKRLELSDAGKDIVKLKSLDLRTDFEQVRAQTHCSFERKETTNHGRAAQSGQSISRSAIWCQTLRLGLEQQIRMLKSERDKNGPGSPSSAKEHSSEVITARPQRVEGRAELRKCFICRKKGHIARDCCNKTVTPKVGALHEVPFQGGAEMEAESAQPRDGQVGSDKLTLFGMHNAEAAAELHVCKGVIGDREVDVLRDAGCSTAVVRTSFVTDRRT